jgi:short-subunit dehydrogenase
VHVLTVCPGYVRTNISLNALSADGSRYARMDASTGGGLSAEAVAAEVLDAIARRKREIYPSGWMEKLSLVLKRVSPPLLDQLLRRRLGEP